MQLVQTPAGDSVAVMAVKEVLVLESALSHYVLERPDSTIAVRMLADASRFNEDRETRMEEQAEGVASARA